MLKILNKLFGSLVLLALLLPIVCLATLMRYLHVIDLLLQRKPLTAIFSLMGGIFKTLVVFSLGCLTVMEAGWRSGLSQLILTAPQRISHFFRKELFFGLKEGESVSKLFPGEAETTLTGIFGEGFFSRLSLKFISLTFPMEIYLSHDAASLSPHTDISIYLTEVNIRKLHNKYANQANDSQKIVKRIQQYLQNELIDAKERLKVLRSLPANDDTKPGRIATEKETINMLQTAQRSVHYFLENKIPAPDLDRSLPRTSAEVLNYVWLAIENEAMDEDSISLLKQKLVKTLFLIQRGYNITDNNNGVDVPECPTGAVGLLIRVIAHENIEDSLLNTDEYEAGDPTPTNLSAALKTKLDKPFVSSYEIINQAKHQNYLTNPEAYKKQQKEAIKVEWEKSYADLINNNRLDITKMNDIIEAGVEAWEPPSPRLSVH